MYKVLYIVPISGNQDINIVGEDKIRVGNVYNTDRQKIILSRNTEDGDSYMDVMAGIATFTDLNDSAKKYFALSTTAAAPLLIPTQSPGDNTTKAASTAFVTAAIAAHGTPALSAVLAVGNTTGSYDIQVQQGQAVKSEAILYPEKKQSVEFWADKIYVKATNTSTGNEGQVRASSYDASSQLYATNNSTKETSLTNHLDKTEIDTTSTAYAGIQYTAAASAYSAINGTAYTIYDRVYNDLRYASISHNLLSATHPDTVAGSPVLGDVIIGNGTPKWDKLAGHVGSGKRYLAQQGTGSISALPAWEIIPAQGTYSTYMSNTASDVAGLYKSLTTPDLAKTTFTTASIGAGNTLLRTWISEPNFPNLSFIPQGQFDMHIHASAAGGTRDIHIYAELWEANAAGADITKIGTTAYTLPVLTGIEIGFISDFTTVANYIMAATTSRLKIKVYAHGEATGSSPDVSLYYGGDANTSFSIPSNTVDATSFVPYTGATANVSLSTFKLTANTLESTVAIGTAPLVVTSTTLVSNLNADLLGGQHASAFLTSVTAHNLLSTTHGDTTAASCVRGDIIRGSATATWERLAKGATGKFLTTDATDTIWSTATLPTTATGTGTILRADGTNWVATTNTYPTTTPISQILFATAANVIGGSTTFLTDGTYLIVGGTALIGSEILSVQKNQNAATIGQISNTTSGTSSSARLRASSSSYLTELGQFSATSTAYGTVPANGGYILTTGASLTLMASDVAGIMNFATGGTAARMKLLAAGNLLINASAISLNEICNITQAQIGGVNNTTLYVNVTTSGAVAGGYLVGMQVIMGAGYTGSTFTSALAFDNPIAGTSSTYTSDTATYGYRLAGNRGVGGYARGVTTGHNVGGLLLAGGGAVNYGLWAASTVTKNSATNVGVFGCALNGGTSPIQIGGYFTLYNAASAPNCNASAALICDNAAQTSDIFVARDNGTAKFTIADGGNVSVANLTAGRIVFAGASGLLTDDADMTFVTDTLTVTHIAKATYKSDGIHSALSTTYISGTGTAGADNTAQTVKTITIAANTLTQVGDRLRIRAYWSGDTGTAITGTIKVNTVPIADITDVGGTTLFISEAWLHYIDNTHANILEQEAGALGALSAVNVAGFTWDAIQNIDVTQDAVLNNHIIVYAVIVDVMPKGY